MICPLSTSQTKMALSRRRCSPSSPGCWGMQHTAATAPTASTTEHGKAARLFPRAPLPRRRATTTPAFPPVAAAVFPRASGGHPQFARNHRLRSLPRCPRCRLGRHSRRHRRLRLCGDGTGLMWDRQRSEADCSAVLQDAGCLAMVAEETAGRVIASTEAVAVDKAPVSISGRVLESPPPSSTAYDSHTATKAQARADDADTPTTNRRSATLVAKSSLHERRPVEKRPATGRRRPLCLVAARGHGTVGRARYRRRDRHFGDDALHGPAGRGGASIAAKHPSWRNDNGMRSHASLPPRRPPLAIYPGKARGGGVCRPLLVSRKCGSRHGQRRQRLPGGGRGTQEASLF